MRDQDLQFDRRCHALYSKPCKAAIHARLVRTTTCANGCKCDYTIFGDRDDDLRAHPEYEDPAGYRRNR